MSSPTRKAFSLEGKAILVTGASSGLGRQVAISCAQRGAQLIITGRDSARLEETRDRLVGTHCTSVPADLTSPEGRDRVARACQGINGVVHCAGKQKHCPIRQLTESAMTDMYAINFLAPVMLTQQLLRDHAIATRGSIVFMLSTAAHTGTRGVAPYAAMKSALLGIIRCLALEVAKREIRVNGISPSAVATPMWDAQQLNEQQARHPLGLGEPSDVANAAIYLLADASRWVTGTTLVMDGGAVL